MTVTELETQHARPRALNLPGKYLSLTTYRRDGTPVATPVWFVEDEGRLFAITAADSYKAKRLRRNPAAMVAPCTAGGKLKDEAIPVVVEFLPRAEWGRVDRLMARKYRVDKILVLPLYHLVMRLRGKPVGGPGNEAYLAMTPR
jgi:PPOX class probable F420-dependent enzyme